MVNAETAFHCLHFPILLIIHIQGFYIQVTQNILTWEWSHGGITLPALRLPLI